MSLNINRDGAQPIQQSTGEKTPAKTQKTVTAKKINVVEVAKEGIGKEGIKAKGLDYPSDKSVLPKQDFVQKAVERITIPKTPKQMIDNLTQKKNELEAKVKDFSSEKEQIHEKIKDLENEAQKSGKKLDKQGKTKELKENIANLNKELSKIYLEDADTKMQLAYVTDEIDQKRAEILAEGKPLKSGLPAQFATTPEFDSSKLNKELEQILGHIIEGIPKLEIDLSKPVKTEGEEVKYNNYGYNISDDQIIEKNPKDGKCTFKYGDQIISGYYNVKEKENALNEGKHVETQVFSNRDTQVNCDKTLMKTLENGVATFAIADGCGWGEKVARAADLAVNTSTNAFEEMMKETPPKTLRDIADLKLKAMMVAEKEINRINNSKKESPIGTTTLLDGTLVQASDGKKYAVFASVGDSKAYVLRREGDKFSCIEVTKGSRGNIGDARDCGGRLGPKTKSGGDFRNLAAYCLEVKPGDLILSCSDGIHDNFDPEGIGLLPTDLGLKGESWKDKDIPKEEQQPYLEAKGNWATQELGKMYGKAGGNKEEFKDAVYQYIKNLNENSMIFLMQNVAQLPDDHIKYPGKVDHAGSIFLEVK